MISGRTAWSYSKCSEVCVCVCVCVREPPVFIRECAYTISYHLIPCHTISYHLIPSHTISYHLIPSHALYLFQLLSILSTKWRTLESIKSFTYSLIHSLTHSYTHLLTHALPYSLIHALTRSQVLQIFNVHEELSVCLSTHSYTHTYTRMSMFMHAHTRKYWVKNAVVFVPCIDYKAFGMLNISEWMSDLSSKHNRSNWLCEVSQLSYYKTH